MKALAERANKFSRRLLFYLGNNRGDRECLLYPAKKTWLDIYNDRTNFGDWGKNLYIPKKSPQKSKNRVKFFELDCSEAYKNNSNLNRHLCVNKLGNNNYFLS